ncbi:MAG: hypothetical protein ACOCZL_02355 [Bacteroidota bacterium]
MFKLFKKNGSKKAELNFADIDGIPLKEGDTVECLRYDLGKSKIIKTLEGLAYQSIESGKIVHWARMVDATTKNQKVRKEA